MRRLEGRSRRQGSRSGRREITACLLLLVSFFSSFPVYAENKTPAMIIPYDAVTSPGIEVWPQAKVITKRFQILERPVGGDRIEFLEGDRYLGLALTGGDGIGAIRYTPLNEGVHRIRVRFVSTSDYESKEEEMLLGVWDKSRRLLLVSVESLRERPKEAIFPFFGRAKRDTERRALNQAADSLADISKHFNIVYLYHGEPSHLPEIRSWLYSNKFPVYPLLLWDESGRFIRNLIAERKKNIKGVVIASGDEPFLFEREEIRTFLLVEKKKGSEYKHGPKEAVIVSDWREIKKNID